ncbi:unnamed protein product [Oikopleura dioica]|uniref:Uncharacterized protein n=1 Tax=Oikopleura dioica TaxID=34765 RepID=E4XR47_OIKDI|nr:unnamed protein product [Oikopleura dioica]
MAVRIDETIGEVCHDACYATYEACTDACDSRICEMGCMTSYTDCFRSCPCYDFCPNGCEGCGNSICTCKSPETDNSHYIQCIHEGTHKLDDCFKTCTANSTCHETCLEDMRRESKMCPCMEDCPLGCPCEGAYDCQNYVTVMCQATSQPSAKDFSYAISTNGLLQNRRYYTSPLTTDSALPKGSQFLYKAGFSLLNGQIYVFGGVQDYQKIAIINECNIVETARKLNNAFDVEFGSLLTVPETTDKVVLCQGSSQKCESFNGVESVVIANTRNAHNSACMGLNQGQATIIAGHDSTNGTVETFELRHDQVERVEWDGNNVTSTSVINTHDAECFNPIVFETAPDQCQDFCSEDFCYDLGIAD